MGLRDTLKKSLGYESEEDDSYQITKSAVSGFASTISNAVSSRMNNFSYEPEEPQVPQDDFYMEYERYNQQYRGDFTIVPEQSLYELILIRPKSLDDINYIVDQVLDNNNPVIVDLSFLEKESPSNFKLAGEKIKAMRSHHDVESFLISRCEGRNMIIIAPPVIKIIKKD